MFFGDGHAKDTGYDPKTVRNGHIFKKNVNQVTKTDFEHKLCVLRRYLMDIHSIHDKLSLVTVV